MNSFTVKGAFCFVFFFGGEGGGERGGNDVDLGRK